MYYAIVTIIIIIITVFFFFSLRMPSCVCYLQANATKRQLVLPAVPRAVVHAGNTRGDLQVRPGKPGGEDRLAGVQDKSRYGSACKCLIFLFAGVPWR